MAVFLPTIWRATAHYGELYTIPTGLTDFVIGYQVDPANVLDDLHGDVPSAVMIFIYATGLHDLPGHLAKEDYPEALPREQGSAPDSRFMAYISLFATGMLGVGVPIRCLTFFVFWEIMGLCSYL